MRREDIESKIKQLNPTILLEIVLLFFFFIILSAGIFFSAQNFEWFWYVPLIVIQTLIVFLMFTPLHDGVHFQISRNRFLNEIFLFCCWPVFLNNPFLFRKIHFQHHARTNDGKKDPDHFTSSKKLWKRVSKSFLLVFYYHWFYFRRIRNMKDLGHWIASVIFPLLLLNLGLVLFFNIGLGILLVWLLPTFLGVGLLAYANTAWPHHPARDTSRYKNTRNTYVPWVVQLVMLNQNLHLVHHLKPNMPWYQYPEYIRQNYHEIQRKGGQTLSYTRRAEAFSLVPQWATQALDQFWHFTGL